MPHGVAPMTPERAALLRLLAEPHGCPFCDSGKLRNPAKDHTDDCPYKVAATVVEDRQAAMTVNGKKTILGAAALVVAFGPTIVNDIGPKVADEVAGLIAEGGGDPARFMRIAGHVFKIGAALLALAGLIHKAHKSGALARAGRVMGGVDPGPLVAAVALALLSSWMAAPVGAQDVGAPGWMNLSARWGAYGAVKYRLSADAPDLAPVPSSRIQGSATIARLFLAGRLDADSVSVGEESYRSLEGHVLAAVRVYGPVAIAGTWGYARPALGDSGRDLEIFGGGVFVGDGLRWSGNGEVWAYVGVVKRRGVGAPLLDEPSFRFVTALQVPIRDKTSAVSDVMTGPGWSVTVGAAVRLR